MNKDILIIGAGIAGLSAATYLQNNGFQVTVLEAQNKIGGRIQTDYSQGVAIEDGANWIHKAKGNPITVLAQTAHLDTIIDEPESLVVYDIDGSIYPPDLIRKAEKKFRKAIDKIEGKKKQNFATAFYQKHPEVLHDRLWTYMLSAYFEFDTGADIYDLSARDFYDDEEFKGDDLIVTNGLDKMLQPLAEDIDIQLNTTVTHIDYRTDIIHVKTNKEAYFVDKVLVTVPLGVLKQNSITFSPILPSLHQNAIDDLATGMVNKFTCFWETPFWDKNQQYIGFTPEEKGQFNYFFNLYTCLNTPALMTFAFGQYAIETEQMTDQAIIDKIMHHLRIMYGNDIPMPTHFRRTKWHSDPYTRGTYSYVPQGVSSRRYKDFETAIDDKIFFAGEHTSRDYRGTIHGAFLSGKREAQKIIKLLEV